MRFQKYAFSFSWKTYRSIRFHTTVSMRFQLSAQKLSKTWRKLHPQRPRGSQSGQEKRRDESLKLRAPGYRLSPNYFQKFKLMPAPDWAQKILCIIVPNRRTVSPEFLSWVRTRRLLSRSRLVWLMHQRNAHSQETFQFDIKSPSAGLSKQF